MEEEEEEEREEENFFAYWRKLQLHSLASKASYSMSQQLTAVLSYSVFPFNQYGLYTFPILWEFLVLMMVLIVSIHRALH